MRFIAWWLALFTRLGIVDFPREKFLEEFTTTIGGTIYSPTMTEESKVHPLVVHELTHVVQFMREGLWLSIAYLFSKRRRGYYESTAAATEMLMFERLRIETVLDSKARVFTAYGLDWEEILNELELRRREIERGEPQPDSKTVYEAYLNWKAEGN